MRSFFSVTFCLFFSISVVSILAQSGRGKRPTETQPIVRPHPKIETTEAHSTINPPPTPPPIKPDENSGEDSDVIRIQSTLVPIPAAVTDARGNAVANLQVKDFQLRINGETQEIAELSRAEAPVRLALLFDNSSSVTVAREFEKKAATRFLKQVLRPSKDQAALYSVSSITQQEQKLTGDTRLLLQAIENFPPPQGATALLDGIVQATQYLRDTVTEGRRVIVIVSDGVDTLSDITELGPVIREALLANCQIYVVKTTDFENFQRTGRRGNNANLQDLTAERRMQELAAQTGGAVYSPLDEKELDAAFAQISAELAQQYVLSYYPVESKADGSFKQISLSVPAQKDLTVRTRKGYYVPKS